MDAQADQFQSFLNNLDDQIQLQESFFQPQQQFLNFCGGSSQTNLLSAATTCNNQKPMLSLNSFSLRNSGFNSLLSAGVVGTGVSSAVAGYYNQVNNNNNDFVLNTFCQPTVSSLNTCLPISVQTTHQDYYSSCSPPSFTSPMIAPVSLGVPSSPVSPILTAESNAVPSSPPSSAQNTPNLVSGMSSLSYIPQPATIADFQQQLVIVNMFQDTDAASASAAAIGVQSTPVVGGSPLLPSPTQSPLSDYSDTESDCSDQDSSVPISNNGTSGDSFSQGASNQAGSATTTSTTVRVPRVKSTPKQQQLKQQQKFPPKKATKAKSGGQGQQPTGSTGESDLTAQDHEMTMNCSTAATVAVENGNMNPWTFSFKGKAYRADGSLIKRQHIMIIASCDQSEIYNIENQTANVDDDGVSTVKGIKVTKALRSRSRASQGSTNVQKFKLHFVAYDKLNPPTIVPIPNCSYTSGDITYLANTKNMSPSNITKVEQTTPEQLPKGFITQNSLLYLILCDRIKWGKSNHFTIGFQDPVTKEIVHYITETDVNRLAPTHTKKVSGYLSVPMEYKHCNLVAGFYSKKDRTTTWSQSSYQLN